jgi:hypothetical protein
MFDKVSVPCVYVKHNAPHVPLIHDTNGQKYVEHSGTSHLLPDFVTIRHYNIFKQNNQANLPLVITFSIVYSIFELRGRFLSDK